MSNPFAGVGYTMGNVNLLSGGLQGAIAAQEDRRKQSQIAFENAFQMARAAQEQANWNLSRGDRLSEQAVDNAWRSKVFANQLQQWQTTHADELAKQAREDAWRKQMFGVSQDWKGKEFGLEKDKFDMQKQLEQKKLDLMGTPKAMDPLEQIKYLKEQYELQKTLAEDAASQNPATAAGAIRAGGTPPQAPARGYWPGIKQVGLNLVHSSQNMASRVMPFGPAGMLYGAYNELSTPDWWNKNLVAPFSTFSPQQTVPMEQAFDPQVVAAIKERQQMAEITRQKLAALIAKKEAGR